MLENAYQFALLLSKEDGSPLGLMAVEPDWEPAAEWTRFYFVRRAELPVNGNGGAASIHPLWDRSKGEPYCRGFRVAIPREGSRPVTSDFTITVPSPPGASGRGALRRRRQARRGRQLPLPRGRLRA